MARSLHLLGCQLVRTFAGNQDQLSIRLPPIGFNCETPRLLGSRADAKPIEDLPVSAMITSLGSDRALLVPVIDEASGAYR
jgi:hypothetical protein